MTDQIKFDDAPSQEFIDLMSESFKLSEAGKKMSMDMWAKDKSRDFYLGMMVAVGIAMQGCEGMIDTKAPGEAMLSELNFLNGQLSTIIKEKESKIILV